MSFVAAKKIITNKTYRINFGPQLTANLDATNAPSIFPAARINPYL
jgi:hypothetical protein